MAIKLPKYNRQVGVSGEAAGQRGDIGSAGQDWRDIGKMAGAGVKAVGQVADMYNQAQAKKAEVEEKKDNISTVTGQVQRGSRIETLKTLSSQALKDAAQVKGDDLTEEEAFAVTKPLREAADKDLAENVYPQIRDPELMAKYLAEDAERNGRAGSVAAKADYDVSRTEFQLAELDTAGTNLILAGDYAGADAMLEAVKDDIGGTRYLKMQEKFQEQKESHFISAYSSGETIEELAAQSEMIDADDVFKDHVKRKAKKANNTVRKQVKAEEREQQREEEIRYSGLLANKQLSVQEIQLAVKEKVIGGSYGLILEKKVNKDMAESLPQKSKTKLAAFQRETQKTQKNLYDLEKSLVEIVDDISKDDALNEDERFFMATTATKLYGMAGNPKIGRDVVRSVQKMMEMEAFISSQGVEVQSGWSAYNFINSINESSEQSDVKKQADSATEYLDVLYKDAAISAMGDISVGADITQESFGKRIDTPPVKGAQRGGGNLSNNWYVQKPDGGWQIWEN